MLRIGIGIGIGADSMPEVGGLLPLLVQARKSGKQTARRVASAA